MRKVQVPFLYFETPLENDGEETIRNEMEVGTVSTMLRPTKVSGGAYIGVGP